MTRQLKWWVLLFVAVVMLHHTVQSVDIDPQSSEGQETETEEMETVDDFEETSPPDNWDDMQKLS